MTSGTSGVHVEPPVPVPEPSMLMLGVSGYATVLLRRGRRARRGSGVSAC
jgi:hypothetical protein